MSEGKKSGSPRKSGSPGQRARNQEPRVKKPEAKLKAESTKPKAKNHSDFGTPHSALKELPTENRQPQTEKMEVHHHPQLEHKPKQWKEYLLEYFMIFLAVTTGFFAESFREHLANKEKEHKYIIGMVRDLKRDTADASDMIAKENNLLLEIRSALQIPVTQLGDLNKQDTFYYHFLKFFIFEQQFSQNDNTLVQLKNAGGFSVIQKEGVADSIVAVSSYYEFVKANNAFYHNDFLRVEDFTGKVIKVPVLPVDKDANPIMPPMLRNTEVFIRHDINSLEQLYNLIKIEKIELESVPKVVQEYKTRATRLLVFLQKEYDLKDE